MFSMIMLSDFKTDAKPVTIIIEIVFKKKTFTDHTSFRLRVSFTTNFFQFIVKIVEKTKIFEDMHF